ncbi:DMT family transporter [Melioribacter sp. OK-6-Me]|uniref:DMT family transporter n=1 Tax=unclassified Melioribacter TaxID=2627329 RepID=UPI003ED97D1C
MKNKFTPAHFLGEGALLLMTIIWGGTFVIVKEAINDINPMLFIALRFSIASLLVITLLLYKRYKFSSSAFRSGFVLGIFLFLGFTFQTVGLKYTTATKSGFITGSLVVMIPPLQLLIEKKKPTKGALIGTLLVFFGIILLSSGSSTPSSFLENFGQDFNLGDYLTLICALFFALHVVYMDIISPGHDFWLLFLSQLITVALLAWLAAISFHTVSFETFYLNINGNLINGILYTSVLATFVNFGLQTRFQKEVSPTKAGIIYSFEPIFAALFAYFILNEKITNFGIAGGIFIFSGLIISEVYDYYFNTGK